MNFNVAFVDLVTSMLVFAGMAKNFVFSFTMNALGHISRVYKRAAFQELNLQRECYGMAARMLAKASSFNIIRGAEAGITREKMLGQFKNIFGDDSVLSV